jgi:hypothetical protein
MSIAYQNQAPPGRKPWHDPADLPDVKSRGLELGLRAWKVQCFPCVVGGCEFELLAACAQRQYQAL